MINQDMKIIESTYRNLLADVADRTGLSEIRGSSFELQWCLNEAPKLEKYVLECVEVGIKPDPSRFPWTLRRLVADVSNNAVHLRFLRQLLLFCYKADVPSTNEQIKSSVDTFLSTNTNVMEFSNSLARESPRLLDSVRRHCQSVLFKFREKAIKPGHGPGSSTSPKARWQTWYESIEAVYPYSDYMCLYFNQAHVAQLEDEPSSAHIVAKLYAVPKDSRGPRLICVHPAESIWIQQGVRRELERAISLDRSHRGPWPNGHIHFDDQTVNGSKALSSSIDRRYATLDMKEASDRISDALVQVLFGRKYKYFGCCRAQKVDISSLTGKANALVDIHSYAPMGNATTFPVQSLVFWAICVASLQRQGFHQPDDVFVFGDDLLVPTECVEGVIDDLETFGLLVNRRKSFWRGAFRESCGIDAFNGVDVTPIRWKTTPTADHLVSLQSLSDLGQRLRLSGYEGAATNVYTYLRNKLKLYGRDLFRTNNVNHGGIAEYVERLSAVWMDAYWHRNTQQYVSPVWRLEAKEHKALSHDWNHVLESVLSLERTGRSVQRQDRVVSRRHRLALGWIWIE
jgi:hypothetical protein